eukprot:TRINITY_DN7174_c0_g1_i3.p2 TRINITY_DN7174_c0_g1~~TRINITY_DN7174_c0_g1_i3.p2  ORF type:complete len:222 (+),score=17.32 TRINITY_DN7174_c0_g1_i3:170-835(+)
MAAATNTRKNADYKIIIIGPSGSGKTCLMERFNTGHFAAKTTQTLGVSFILKEAYGMYLALWDTAGQEQYATLASFYARDAHAAIICYDITAKDSFRDLDKWYAYLDNAPANCQHILVGCKSDLVETSPASREVQATEGYERAQDKGSARFFECSSKTGHNIDTVFEALCETLRPGSTSNQGSAPSSVPTTPVRTMARSVSNDGIQLGTPRSLEQKSGGCC